MIRAVIVVAVCLLAGCDRAVTVPRSMDADALGHSAPTQHTVTANNELASLLDLDDPADFVNAERGLIARSESLRITRDDGRVVWDQDQYGFVAGDAPESVNPSLWRQARLNGLHGLYEVTPGVYQVRGYDLANLTIIVGETGWILVDPLTMRETAAAALAFARAHLPPKPVVAVLFTHSHVDHFGGVDGVLTPEERSNVRIVAPAGFLHEAVSENVIAGPAMTRRAGLMYGRPLARSIRGHVDTGLGKEPAANGRVSILAPTDIVDHTVQQMTLDGVRFEFQFAPGSEAPAEFTFFLPDLGAFCGAEVLSRNLHNVYTLRGAKVRDALRWSNYIDEALGLFGQRATSYFGSHHWPVWGTPEIVAYMKKQRDVYKYIHDQTLRMANQGLTPAEIAEAIELPESLRREFAVRGYYGTARHNAKAVYQFYFGWYDGVPAHLDPLPPEPAGRRYVEFMGGADELLSNAEQAYAAGDYRWVAQVVNHLVFAEPDNVVARALLARSYDQLGYQAESGPWRDVYLTGAYELRHGPAPGNVNLADAGGLLARIPIASFLDSMATRIDGQKASGVTMTINVVFTDVDETHVLEMENAVLHHHQGIADADASATLTLTRSLFLRLVTGSAGLRETLFSDELEVDGSVTELISFFLLLDRQAGPFNIVTP
jgi:alkyl sulfatase BDS1-like metallo-beta-lactamase superfamily hydrolase